MKIGLFYFPVDYGICARSSHSSMPALVMAGPVLAIHAPKRPRRSRRCPEQVRTSPGMTASGRPDKVRRTNSCLLSA